jgi:AcrR family transcriptional regulator
LALTEEKRTTILNAALQCFGKFGYEKASINDIAVAAHISKASVFQYFGSKKHLYIYLLEYCKKIIEGIFDKEALDSQTDLFDRIMTSSKIEMESFKTQPFILLFISSVWEETSPDVLDSLVILTEETCKFRNDMILREDDALKFKNPEDAGPVFQMLLLMAEGYAARYRGADTFDFDTVMDDFQKNIAILRKNFYKEEYQK